MADLGTLELGATLYASYKMISCAKVLLNHVDQGSSLAYQQTFHHIIDYMIGQLEKAASAAENLQPLNLAAATRNLFELSFEVDFVCISDQNMDRFIVDAAIDELDIMQKFLPMDKQNPDYVPDEKVEQREQALKAQITEAKLAKPNSLRASEIAQAVNRKAEYDALYQVYSKMSHATAWAIIGECDWNKMAVLLLVKSNVYAGECIKRMAVKTGLPMNATFTG
jgi:hypothetical protein